MSTDILCIRFILYFCYAELPKAGIFNHLLALHVYSSLTIKACECGRLKINRVSKTSFDMTLKEGNFRNVGWMADHTRIET